MDYLYGVQYDPFLEHYGRKGMKWYQHIFTDGTGGSKRRVGGAKKVSTESRPATHRPSAESTTTSAKEFWKNRAHYTTAELQTINNRKQQEAALKRFMTEELGVPASKRYAAMGRQFLSDVREVAKTVDTIGKTYNTLTGRGNKNKKKKKKDDDDD